MVTKYEAVANTLRDRILEGELGAQQRLPGETDMARQFGVSRGTVRQALASLQRDGLIQTSTGSGSYVSFDGQAFDGSLGWTAGTARAGSPTSARIICLGRLEIPDLANRLGLSAPDFLAVDRLRCTAQDDPVSLERSRVPWQLSFDSVLATGLIDDSLTSTLLAHGLRGVQGTETVTVAALGTDDAAILGSRAASIFLRTERTLYDDANQLVEHVVSLLHPEHFALHYDVGQHSAARTQF